MTYSMCLVMADVVDFLTNWWKLKNVLDTLWSLAPPLIFPMMLQLSCCAAPKETPWSSSAAKLLYRPGSIQQSSGGGKIYFSSIHLHFPLKVT